MRFLAVLDHPSSEIDASVRGPIEAALAEIDRAGAQIDRSSDLLPDLAEQHANYLRLLNAAMARGRPGPERADDQPGRLLSAARYPGAQRIRLGGPVRRTTTSCSPRRCRSSPIRTTPRPIARAADRDQRQGQRVRRRARLGRPRDLPQPALHRGSGRRERRAAVRDAGHRARNGAISTASPPPGPSAQLMDR